MASVVSVDTHIFNAEQFKEAVSETVANTKIFFVFGKGVPWSNDAAPIQANTSIAVFNDVWNNMVGGKLITGNDIYHVIPRYDWTANTKYAAYDHSLPTLNLINANTRFYVITDEWNVYKCIANNSGANSTTKPTSTLTSSTFQTADGYIWKFMYNINSAERLRFTNSDYIPIKRLTQDDGSLQWDVQEDAVSGGIHSILITNTGSNYNNANSITITITGDGSGANAYAQINSSTNLISSIIITVPGQDYTFANVAITDTGDGSGANARAIISPPGGHGSDPLSELGGFNLMFNPRLRNSEGGILSLDNEFRQIALIQDPYLYNTTNVASNTVFSQLSVATLTGASVEYEEDEFVYQGGSLANSTFSGVVYGWDSGNNKLYLTNVRGTATTDLLIGANSTAARFISSVSNPTLKKYSGKLLYIDNIVPIQRASDQTEDFKLVLRF